MKAQLSIWWALAFMAAGYAIRWLHDRNSWRKYDEGKKEVADGKYARETDGSGRVSYSGRKTSAGNAPH